MDPVTAYTPSSSVAGILASPALTPSYPLLSAELSLSVPALFGSSSTVVGISARGQLLSANVTFQNSLRPLQSRTTTGETDLEALSLRAQTLVDAFNTMQATITDIEAQNRASLGSLTGADDLSSALDTQALANYVNVGSTLSSLSQLGIELQPALYPGGSSRLTLDSTQLEAAFLADAQGANALLSSVAGSFSAASNTFISRSGSQYPSLDALLQTNKSNDLFSGLPQLQPMSMSDLLASQSLNNQINWRLVYSAIMEYTAVSQMFQ